MYTIDTVIREFLETKRDAAGFAPMINFTPEQRERYSHQAALFIEEVSMRMPRRAGEASLKHGQTLMLSELIYDVVIEMVDTLEVAPDSEIYLVSEQVQVRAYERVLTYIHDVYQCHLLTKLVERR